MTMKNKLKKYIKENEGVLKIIGLYVISWIAALMYAYFYLKYSG